MKTGDFGLPGLDGEAGGCEIVEGAAGGGVSTVAMDLDGGLVGSADDDVFGGMGVPPAEEDAADGLFGEQFAVGGVEEAGRVDAAAVAGAANGGDGSPARRRKQGGGGVRF